MNSKAVKFLLNLLSFPNYRAPLSQVKPTSKMKAAERNKIFRELCDRQLVACSEEIKTLRISSKGKSLLKIEKSQETLTPEELQVLQASAQGKITPAQTGLTTDLRSKTIENLVSRDLLRLQKQVKEVWLSEAGKKFLVEEYDATDHYGNFSFKMLSDYLRLIRKFYQKQPVIYIENTANTPVRQEVHRPKLLEQQKSSNSPVMDLLQTIRDLDIQLGQLAQAPKTQPSDWDILQTINQLDRDLKTDSYLPILYLREKLETSLSRQELDAALSRLQENQHIQLKSLEEVLHYSSEYFEAAIAQEHEWSLFFIVLNR